MAESEATTFGSFSESDGDSILSGSVCYSTDLSEDSEAESDLSEESLMTSICLSSSLKFSCLPMTLSAIEGYVIQLTLQSYKMT